MSSDKFGFDEVQWPDLDQVMKDVELSAEDASEQIRPVFPEQESISPVPVLAEPTPVTMPPLTEPVVASVAVLPPMPVLAEPSAATLPPPTQPVLSELQEPVATMSPPTQPMPVLTELQEPAATMPPPLPMPVESAATLPPTQPNSLNDIKRLRDLTGVGLLEAKKLLEEAHGDFSRAVLLSLPGVQSATVVQRYQSTVQPFYPQTRQPSYVYRRKTNLKTKFVMLLIFFVFMMVIVGINYLT